MTTFEKMPSRSMPSATNDPLCPKFKKLKEEERKTSGKGRPLLGSKDAGKRVVGKSKRVANFGAGPAAVSDQVMLNLQHELLSYESSGMVSESADFGASVPSHLCPARPTSTATCRLSKLPSTDLGFPPSPPTGPH